MKYFIIIFLALIIVVSAYPDNIYLTRDRAWLNVTVIDTTDFGERQRVRFYISDREIRTVFLEDIILIEKEKVSGKLFYTNKVSAYKEGTKSIDILQKASSVFYNPDGSSPFIDIGVGYVGTTVSVSVFNKTTSESNGGLALEAGIGIPLNRVTLLIGGSYSKPIENGQSYGAGLKIRIYTESGR